MKSQISTLLLFATCSSVFAQSPDSRPPAGPIYPDTPIAFGYDGAARALAYADENPILSWTYRTWCVTGYRTAREAGEGQTVDRPLDSSRDLLSQLGYVATDNPQEMPSGGVRFLDNAWYFGTDLTGMVVVKVPEGLLMFDALTNAEDMQAQGIDQMKAAGLDPSQIKYIFIGHEHFDHYGGINLVLDNHAPNAKIVSTVPAADGIAASKDRILTEPVPARFIEMFGDLTPNQVREKLLYTVPKRIDVRIDAFPGMDQGMQKIRVGDVTTVTAMLTPGHTPGQMTVIVPTMLNGKPEKLLIWSGNDNFPGAITYAASTDFVSSIATSEAASVFINTHAYQGAIFHHLRILKADPSASNPMAMGTDGVQRYLGLYAECQRAQDRRRRDGTWYAL